MARKYILQVFNILSQQKNTNLKYFETHLNTVRKTNMKKINDNKCWKNMGKEESLFTAGHGVKCFNRYGNQNGGFPKN